MMQSSQFDFPDGSEELVVLERPNQLVEFDVEARASGPQTRSRSRCGRRAGG